MEDEMNRDNEEIKLTENAKRVLEKRYLAKNDNGEVVETPKDLFRRVAKNVAKANKRYDKKVSLQNTEEEFYKIMANLEFLPNSPTLMNAGRELQQLSACFVLPIFDSMDSIFETIKDMAMIQKSGGGTGFSFSRLRPKNSMVKTTGGIASGPISFLKVFNSATEAVKQGGTRRGANMGILRVDHPDILEFIKCKESDKEITNFNISVTVTEDFMKKVIANEDYDLIDPHTKKHAGKFNAKEVFDLIIKMAWKNGEPGIIFLDRMNKFNPTPELGEYESTNPCVTGDTFVSTEFGLMKIKDIARKYGDGGLRILTDDRVIDTLCAQSNNSSGGLMVQAKPGVSLNTISRAWKTGIKPTFKVTTKCGYELTATGDHRLMTTQGWVQIKDLKIGEHKVLIQSEVGKFNKDNQLSFYSPNREEKFVDKILSIKYVGMNEVYDLTEPLTHSMIVNGMVTHQCGEQILLPYESCNLGSINLSKMVTDGKIDWDKLAWTTKTAVHFLDNVVDMNKYPLKKIKDITKANRKIGLGVMGFADMLIKVGIKYNSEEGLATARKVMGFILKKAKQTSRALAKKRGAFPNFEHSVYRKSKEGPLRNATLTTIAPTGSLSIIAGCSSGVEPLFAISYTRKILDNERLVEVNPYFKEIAEGRGFFSPELMKLIADKGSIKEMDEIPQDVKELFVTSHDISARWHIKMQAVFQEYTDNAVSKTVNFPQDATVDDVRNVYMLAHKLCCKGVTIYRDKSREEQVLNIENNLKKKIEVSKIIPRPRPTVTTGTTTKVATGCGNLYITINEDEQHLPFEVFMQMGKAGGCAMSQLEAIGRLVSLALRSGIDINSIIEQLKGIRCPNPSWEKGGRIFSCSDAIARVIERRLIKAKEKKGPKPARGSGSKKAGPDLQSSTTSIITKKKLNNIVGVCPDCGAALYHVEGCNVCNSCGYSTCG